MKLLDKNTSYMIISSDNIDDVISVLYSKEYSFLDIKEYYNKKDHILAYNYLSTNEELKNDALFILKNLKINHIYLKNKGEYTLNEVSFKANSNSYNIVLNEELDDNLYICDGIFFSIKKIKKYWSPKNLGDLSTGMIVEYQNKGIWEKMEIKNPIDDYNSFLKLFIKYNKVRAYIDDTQNNLNLNQM